MCRKGLLLFIAMVPAILCVGWIGAGPVSAGEGSKSISSVQDKTRQAIEREINAQQQADEWSQEKEQLISELRQNKTRLDWARYQNEKYSAYIEREKERMAELQRRRDEMKGLRRNLEPYLDQLITRLDGFIDSDLEFLSREREERIQYLRDSMNDYDLGMSEKLRRVLEALHVEAEYGSSIEASSETLDIQGRTIEAEVLRIGRVALFYRSMDGEKVGRWNSGAEAWEPVSSEFSRAIGDTVDMARQKKSVELVDLPIGGVNE